MNPRTIWLISLSIFFGAISYMAYEVPSFRTFIISLFIFLLLFPVTVRLSRYLKSKPPVQREQLAYSQKPIPLKVQNEKTPRQVVR